MKTFRLVTNLEPGGDQPSAIDILVDGVERGLKHQVLLGVTGSGKTFTMANTIVKIQKPTLGARRSPLFYVAFHCGGARVARAISVRPVAPGGVA